MKRYFMFGQTVESTISLPYLPESDAAPDFSLIWNQLHLDTEEDRLYAEMDGSACNVWMGCLGKYRIDPQERIIHAQTDGENMCYSTLFNIPMSIYFALRGDLLLHCSSVSAHGKLYSFCGNKGSGKSTLTTLISESYGGFYNDDSLRVSEDLSAWGGLQAVKLQDDTLHFISCNKNNTLHQTAFQKWLYCQEPVYQPARLHHVIFLRRSPSTDSFKVEKITSKIHVYLKLIENVIGFNSCFPENLKNRILSTGLLEQISRRLPCYYLTCPNSLEGLRRALAQQLLFRLFDEEVK